MELALVRWLNGLRRPWLDVPAAWLSARAYYVFPVALLVVLAVRRRRAVALVRDGLLAWFVAGLLAEEVLKPLVARPRPTATRAVLATLRVLGRVPPASSYSFPSGTAAGCFAGATWAWMHGGPRWGIPSVALAALASLSRVYAGVHYPTDVLVGALLGVGSAFAARALSRAEVR